MNAVKKQARAARRRMVVSRVLSYVPPVLTAAAVVAAVGIAMPKIVWMPVDPALWVAGWVGAASILSLFVIGVLTWMKFPSLLDAAVEIDRRFDLRERLSSALILDPADRETESGRALIADAERRAETIDVRDQFDWGVRKGLLIPVLPVLLAASLACLPDRAPEQQIAQKQQEDVTRVKQSIKPLIETVRKKREAAEKKGLNEAADLFRKLEAELAKMERDEKMDTKQTLARLNKIKEQLESRRRELGDPEALKKNLQKLENLEAGPADKLAKALKEGDLEKTKEALEELLQKMREGGLSQEDINKLQKQMQRLQQALAEAAAAHEKAKQQLREQIEKARQASDMQKAAELEKQLAEKMTQDASMAQMQQMAAALSKASSALKEGKLSEAQEEMVALEQELQEMIEANQELKDFDELLANCDASKARLGCKQCKGAGCASCMGMGMFPMAMDFAQGKGRGAGARAEEEDDVDFFESRVRDQMRRGETVYGGRVGGPNKKGVSLEEVQETVLASMTEEPEPLEDVPLPKAQREHTREFFNMLREGED